MCVEPLNLAFYFLYVTTKTKIILYMWLIAFAESKLWKKAQRRRRKRILFCGVRFQFKQTTKSKHFFVKSRHTEINLIYGRDFVNAILITNMSMSNRAKAVIVSHYIEKQIKWKIVSVVMGIGFRIKRPIWQMTSNNKNNIFHSKFRWIYLVFEGHMNTQPWNIS